MGGRDRVVRIVGILRAADDVAPPRADAVARIDADDLIRVGSRKTAAQLLVVDVVDWVVRRGSAQTDELALIGAVDREFLVGRYASVLPYMSMVLGYSLNGLPGRYYAPGPKSPGQ